MFDTFDIFWCHFVYNGLCFVYLEAGFSEYFCVYSPVESFDVFSDIAEFLVCETETVEHRKIEIFHTSL